MLALISCVFWACLLLFLWAYIGYPALMAAWAKLAPCPIHRDDIEPTITLLIPTYNEIDVIERKLANALTLDYPTDKLDILVVDDASTDGTRAAVRQFASGTRVTLIEKPTRTGKMSSVNLGVAHAPGEIIVLSDASPTYAPDALRLLMRPFADETVGVAVGTLAVWDAENAVAAPAGLYWRYEAALRGWESETGSTVAVHGNMFAFRRTRYRPPPPGTVNDEFSIAMEALRDGARVVYERGAISYDEASTHMGDEFARRVRINAGRYQALFGAGYLRGASPGVGFRLFSHKLLRPLTPLLMLGLAATNLSALAWVSETAHLPRLRGWPVGVLLAGQAVFYGAALGGWWLEQHGHAIRPLSVIYFFVSSNVAALFGLWRWLRGRQSVTWRKRRPIKF